MSKCQTICIAEEQTDLRQEQQHGQFERLLRSEGVGETGSK